MTPNQLRAGAMGPMGVSERSCRCASGVFKFECVTDDDLGEEVYQ